MTEERVPGQSRILKLWPLGAAILFVLFTSRGQGLAAFLVLVSGIMAFRPVSGILGRFKIDASSRSKLCVGAGLLSIVVHLFTSGGQPVADAAADSVETAADESTEAPGYDDEVDGGYQQFAANADANVNALGQQVPTTEYLSGCRAVDGDTLNCAGESIRLLGIDAPEMPGHCRIGRECAPGDPYVSMNNLSNSLWGNLTIERVGMDRYRRTIAMVYSNGQSLSCQQLRSGNAIYVADWDDGGRVGSECPTSPY